MLLWRTKTTLSGFFDLPNTCWADQIWLLPNTNGSWCLLLSSFVTQIVYLWMSALDWEKIDLNAIADEEQLWELLASAREQVQEMAHTAWNQVGKLNHSSGLASKKWFLLHRKICHSVFSWSFSGLIFSGFISSMSSSILSSCCFCVAWWLWSELSSFKHTKFLLCHRHIRHNMLTRAVSNTEINIIFLARH